MSLLTRSKFITIVLLSIICGTSYAATHAPAPYEFTITQQDYRFSTLFEIDSLNTYEGQVKKSALRLWKSYNLSDANGWQATGQYKWTNASWVMGEAMMEMWITDTKGDVIALIDGQRGHLTSAKFSIYAYDEEFNNECVAVAYLDNACEAFTFYYPGDETRRIAKMRRVTVADARDYWKVQVFHPELIDDRVVRIFAAWAVDSQSYFRIDDVDIKPLPAQKPVSGVS